ncbi:L-serine ammonia-lyase [Gordonia sp. UCD-TK1]|uniref:L-serine ammonia-lyase n=1 Tax=Gordonia sp. UCD-TK1 TaxID=1857893 RepID=UPI00080DE53B|nr:L-serine ammonia-lyase [Gordonia sp. UCD-TK1]OCH81234.1 L-serine ammonia-lyase [Gordonia sp. UCD-TK1]
MTVSVFELFSVGVGPSSSHTVGPMRAAHRFVAGLARTGDLLEVTRLEVDLYGSLAATGAGHGTLTAVLLGLEGHEPESISSETKAARIADMERTGRIRLGGLVELPFSANDIGCHPRVIRPRHPNAMELRASTRGGARLPAEWYYSVGGGFVVTDDESDNPSVGTDVPFGYGSAAELLAVCADVDASISDVVLMNESATRTTEDVRAGLLRIWSVMESCVRHGGTTDGELPGGLRVRRRAKQWRDDLMAEDPLRSMAHAEDWVNLVALAVNEENAAGGRVVTAPTNGAAGIVPAVLHYARRYTPAGRANPDDVTVRFLLAAGAIGGLIKSGASISGADVGCQGEVGSAAAMAAGALAEILGGAPAQVENAAEIAMEHSLGLTCDPIGGLVQIPCIERNAISAGKAINAARMALRGNGTHYVSLDQVIATMKSTGRDMNAKYKETATGGLAVHVPLSVVEC